MNAVIENRNDVIDILIEYGCNVNLQNVVGWTALHYCCVYQPNNREVLQRLLDAKVDPNLINIFGSTPLHIVADSTEDVNIIHLLTLYSSNPNLQDIYGYTPLMNACHKNKNIDVILALINITNNINLANIYGNTALHIACCGNNYEAIRLLLAAGSDLNINNNDNKTAYELADDNGKRIIDKYLTSPKVFFTVEMDYEVLFNDDSENIRNYLNKSREHIDIIVNNETPLMVAVKENRMDVIDVLLQYGCNINCQNKYGETALHYWCVHYPNNRDMLQRLLDAKADPNIPTNLGATPLHYATKSTEDVNIIHLLTLYSSSPNLQDKCGDTPLMNACRYNKNIDIISALCYSFITNYVNLPNSFGYTALHLACRWNNHEAIRVLLDAGANVNITNNNGKTAYELADKEGKRSIDEYLNSK